MDWWRTRGRDRTRAAAFGVVALLAVAAVALMCGVRRAATVGQATGERRADEAQNVLETQYWNQARKLFDNWTPCPDDLCNERFHYWWQAHAADVLVDAYVRTGDRRYRQRLGDLYQGLLRHNGGSLVSEFYDDMEWLALASLRAFDATNDETYRKATLTLWTDIKTGWNDQQGGGIAWRKSQPSYKNTPANAPAAILAARLYERFGDPADLEWSRRIYAWQRQNLIDPITGFVWDGRNRNGDGGIDKDWEFTYCQGAFIGAGVELYRATGERRYLRDAERTARAAKDRLTDPATGIVREESDSDAEGDAGLFKGIYVRYLAELVLEDPPQAEMTELLSTNADRLWQDGKAADGALFSHSWTRAPDGVVTLSVQLSGVKLAERMAALEKRGLSGGG